MDFLVIGGGCYGSFYTRQLLRGSARLDFQKIHVVDKDPNCQVVRELGKTIFDPDSQVEFHFEDWKGFVGRYLEQQIQNYNQGLAVDDQYAPPCIAPHILFELFLERAEKQFPHIQFTPKNLEVPVGTPVDMSLPSGQRALSFATWICPHSCIEPPTCPHTRGPKSWDMKEHLEAFWAKADMRPDSVHYFQCLHYAMGVGTIPILHIVEEYLKFESMLKKNPKSLFAVATVSSCHGLVGLMESDHA